MHKSPDIVATEAFHEAAPPHEPIRLFAYVEALAACGLLILVGVSLFGA